jgi:TRAP transporter TAXI family solute receptor
VTGAEVDKLVADNPYYRVATIPGGMYRGNDGDVQTFGVGATLVTSASVPDDVVYALVKAVFSDIDAFRALLPAFANLDPKQMANDGLSAPLPPGAERYVREAGLSE